MAKSRMPNPEKPSSRPTAGESVAKVVREQTTEPPLVDVAGHGPENAPSASEVWWRTFTLNSREAAAGSPEDYAACGEEDPGAGLELLVSQKSRRKDPR